MRAAHFVAALLGSGLAAACGATSDTAPAPTDVETASDGAAALAETVSDATPDVHDSAPSPLDTSATKPDLPDAITTTDAAVDAPIPDVPDTADAAETAQDAVAPVPDAIDSADGKCTTPEPFDYTCNMTKPETCPGGACLLSLCVGPQLDPHRWDGCKDGTCSPCEPVCPVDCGPTPVVTGSKDYSGDKTLTVWVHGFSNQGTDKLSKLTYGAVKGCGDVLQNMQAFGVKRPCGTDAGADKDPTQLVGVEYYGTIPPDWMSGKDVTQVEQYPFSGGPKGLIRYGKIVAKFIKWRMGLTGAAHVQIACHSMGCLISRQLIENDEEQLASSGKIVRWFTSAGVVAGAKLARLFDNPTVQQSSDTIGLELSDFILMNPDYVQDTTAWWDHRLHEANSPLLGGMLIHHMGATDPKIAQAMNIALLDLLGGSAQPNDGIMYTEDTYFWSQDPAIAPKSKAGKPVPSGLTLVNVDHMTCPGTLATGAIGTAALFHKRKVEIRVTEFTLLNDREQDSLLDFSEHGSPPAEVVVETAVRFNPYLKDTFGQDILVHDDRMVGRTAPMWTQTQGETLKVGQLVLAAPIFDAMTSLWASFKVIESDWYPKYGVAEWAFDDSQDLVAWQGDVPIVDGHTFTASSQYAKATFEVRVHEMW